MPLIDTSKPTSKAVKILAGFVFGFIGLFILLGIIVSSTTPEPQPQVAAPTNTAGATSSAGPRTENQVLADVGQSASGAGSTTTVTYRGVEVEKADSDRPAGSKMVTMSFNVSSFFSKSSLTKDTGKIAAKAFQGIFAANPKFYDVIIWYYGETTDRYGNKKNDVIMTYSIDRVTFGKINWANFNASGLCDFLNEELRRTGTFDTSCNVLANIK